MPTVAESSLGDTPIGSVLKAGTDQISLNQTITFTKYIRLVLPLDGFVFWVRSTIVKPSAMLNMAAFNTAAFGSAPQYSNPANGDDTLIAMGSLHYASMEAQTQTNSYTTNQIVFTSEDEIKDFNEISPDVMYLGEWQGVRFSFGQRRSFYQQADLWHYTGNAVYATMTTQIIDYPAQLDTQNVIVSNSLPLWLAMNQMSPPFPYPPGQRIPLYPSFAVPVNLEPPYGAVHIDGTEAIQSTPYIDQQSSHWQLVEETVVITLQGLRNFNAIDFVDFVLNYTEAFDPPLFGITNMPVVQDEKDPQVELQTLSMRKKVEFRINYYQTRMRNLARQLIETVIVTETVGTAVFTQTITATPI
jgi:hypothetical protein